MTADQELAGETVNLAQHLPAGFELRQNGNKSIVALPEYIDRLAAADISRLPEAGRGRGAIRRLPMPGGANLLIRECRRGGVLRFVNKTRHLSPYRALREIRIGEEAAQRGVPVVRAVAAIIRAGRPFWTCSLVTEEIEETIDLAEYVCWLPATPPREILKEKRDIIDAVGRAVRKMHDAGLYHADLQAGNILVRRSTTGVDVFFVDLDKSFIRPRLPDRLRAHNLRRLNRSIMKMQRALPPMDDDDRRRFLKAYRSAGPIFGEDVSSLLKSCRRSVVLHSLGWRVFG